MLNINIVKTYKCDIPGFGILAVSIINTFNDLPCICVNLPAGEM